MRILIVYGTNSGGTYMVAELIAKTFTDHEVDVQNVTSIKIEDFEKYDLIILGSCSWDNKGMEGQLQEDFGKFVEKEKGKIFPTKKFAVFATGDQTYTYFANAYKYLQEFIQEMKGIQIGTPLKIDRFYLNETENTVLVEKWADEIVKQAIESV